MMTSDQLEKLIKDAEWRIGSYIAGGGSSEGKYVEDQMAKIQEWCKQINNIPEPEPDVTYAVYKPACDYEGCQDANNFIEYSERQFSRVGQLYRALHGYSDGFYSICINYDPMDHSDPVEEELFSVLVYKGSVLMLESIDRETVAEDSFKIAIRDSIDSALTRTILQDDSKKGLVEDVYRILDEREE